jgi:CubicO group peptidase (beta-lactamase class C family)
VDPLPTVSPARVGIQPRILNQAHALLEHWAGTGEVPASALCVGRRGGVVEPRFFGVGPDALFSVASLTKPIVATAAVQAMERGLLTLDDPVAATVPEFSAQDKQDVRVRHLLTHTSGLPDQLPENIELRARHAPVWEFMHGACRQPLLFAPGTRVRYQSMGFSMLAEILQRRLERGLAEILHAEILEPLGMRSSWLGCPPEQQHRIPANLLEPGQEETDWTWNSAYWRGLGAPWGGLFTTPLDLARFSQMMLQEGTLGRARVLGGRAARAMTRNQLQAFPAMAEEDRRCRPWGLGWRLQGGHDPSYGDLLGPHAFGHHGATGCLWWIDPETDAFAIILTTRPGGEELAHLRRVSNIVAAALA